MNIRSELDRRISAALTAAVDGAAPLPGIIVPAADAKFGDYQANGVMAAAKSARTNPRDLAGKVLARLDLDDLAERVEVAGPGFINITLKASFLADCATAAAGDDRLGVAMVAEPKNVVVDYSGPNLAKEMHAGHLRSTVIGDSLARALEFVGHHVIRQNHCGDWGTQYGVLIAHLKRTAADCTSLQIADLEQFYRQAQQLFESDADFADRARREVVALQGGDPSARTAWEGFIGESKRHCRQVYDRLGTSLTAEHYRPESAYNDDLPGVVAALDTAGLLTESGGAKCVFLDEFTGRDDKPLPLIVQKSDGGYLYATTDLAALRFRVDRLKADRILYVTDSRQALHFAQVFAVARRAGLLPERVAVEHVPFGTMLGSDGRPFRTREGTSVKLMDLLEEAEQRAAVMVERKSPDLPAEQAEHIARVVGIGAVKYADLSMDRTSDYKFSWDKMLTLQGNTAPYMQYAYARVQSIFRKGAETGAGLAGARIIVSEPGERELAKWVCRLDETLSAVADQCRPNILTAYLFDLASAFSTFYETCPVLKADPPVRASRLGLCELTARVIKLGLHLLGIDVIERM